MNEGRKICGKEYMLCCCCALFRKINFLRWLSTFRAGQSSKSIRMSDSIQITLVGSASIDFHSAVADSV
jgi:hypothetical protein